MNALDILKYGHLTVMGTLEGVPEQAWDTPGVCGYWSVREIMAHLASYEHMLCDVLTSFDGGEPGPFLRAYTTTPDFNDQQVSERRLHPWRQVLDEYTTVQARTMALVAQIPAEKLRQPGTLPWYGAEYALDDFLVYSFYGHKREHMAQVNVFKDKLKAA